MVTGLYRLTVATETTKTLCSTTIHVMASVDAWPFDMAVFTNSSTTG